MSSESLEVIKRFRDTLILEPQPHDHKTEDQSLIAEIASTEPSEMVLDPRSEPVDAHRPKALKIGIELRLFGCRNRVCFWNGRHPG